MAFQRMGGFALEKFDGAGKACQGRQRGESHAQRGRHPEGNAHQLEQRQAFPPDQVS